jgi:ribosomal-protein-serine acetyltransferase
MFRLELAPDAWLRPLQVRHATEVFALVEANRAHLRQWLPWVDATQSEVDVRGYLLETQALAARDESLTCGLWTPAGLVGVIGYHRIYWPHRRTALGYWLAEGAQGCGLMTRAARALTDHAFAELRLHRVEIAAAVENRRSRAIPERLGFTLEGYRRECEWLYDHFVDHALYGVLAREWRGGT